LAKTTLNIRGRLIDLSDPVVMGIINLTPDSFYGKSRVLNSKDVVKTAEKMLSEGASMLDLGAFSTRPGAIEVSVQEELERLIPAVEAILQSFPEAIISIDSFRAEIANKALDSGASIINDITAGSDPGMFPLIARAKVPYIMMHMRGVVTRMMEDTEYDDMLVEIAQYFQERILKLNALGIADVIIDPGFGFSKTLDQNYELLKNLSYFKALEQPILAGVSRKSMIYKLLNSSPEDAILGTSVLNFAALQKGARILRVHDVKEAVDTIKLFSKIKN
jgi:dihydropteroate synthase